MDSGVYQVVTDFARQVKSLYQIKAVYIYGSHIKGLATENSDIDVAIIVEPVTDNEYSNIFGELFNIAAHYDANLEPNLLIDDGEYCRYSFLAEVMETGQLVEV